MNQDYPNFVARVQRIDRSWRNRVHGEFVLQSNGLLVPKQKRLRFGFPLRGLIMSFVIAVAVKAYLMWFLGTEVYSAEVLGLLNGTTYQQAAAHILMPDQLTLRVVGLYDWLAVQIALWQAGA